MVQRGMDDRWQQMVAKVGEGLNKVVGLAWSERLSGLTGLSQANEAQKRGGCDVRSDVGRGKSCIHIKAP